MNYAVVDSNAEYTALKRAKWLLMAPSFSLVLMTPTERVNFFPSNRNSPPMEQKGFASKDFKPSESALRRQSVFAVTSFPTSLPCVDQTRRQHRGDDQPR